MAPCTRKNIWKIIMSAYGICLNSPNSVDDDDDDDDMIQIMMIMRNY